MLLIKWRVALSIAEGGISYTCPELQPGFILFIKSRTFARVYSSVETEGDSSK